MDALTFKDFGFAYATAPNTWVCQHLNWAVEQGAFALLTGNTGSGKTTLLRMAHPALAPAGQRQGTIELFGQEAEGYKRHQAAGTVGYVGQHPADQIVCDSVWHELAFGMENLGVPQNEMRRRVAEIAHYFGIESWLHAPTAELSGGQMQLLNLAAALACRPRMLLLDEPTAQLDPVAAQDFIAVLVRVNREIGITVVVATHNAYVLSPYATNQLHLGQSEAPATQQGTAKSTNTALPPTLKCPANQAGTTAPERGTAQERQKPCLELREVFFRYERELPWVLRGLNLNVERGSIHALVGGNGSGKSSVLFLAAGTKTPQRGHVVRTAQSQAFLPQDPKLLLVCDTVAEELAEWQSGGAYNENDIAREVERFGLARILNQHPFDTSGGQQQCIALAKLLLAKPEILLLDEPTKGLDAPTRRLLAEVLLSLQQEGKTVVLATHDLAFVNAVAQQVTMLFDGQDAQTEPPAQFFANNLFMKPSAEAQEALGLEGAYSA